MGSAAFLNEVVNQLAQKYLELRQQETGKSIPHEQFATELQKVKMRLADQNVFGVDLNPVAVELAEVSLWLNSIFTPENGRAFVPWFSQQLVCGNSLIGARRQIYRVNQLPTGGGRKAKPSQLWHEHAPEELAWDAELPEDAIFHFLLPDPGMAAYSDKVIKELEPEAIERCKRWNKAFVAEPFTEAQIAHLLRLSKLVDALWKDWAEQQGQLRQRTTDPLPVWEDPTGATEGIWTPLKLKDRIQEQEVLGRDVANTNARLRLKWAMDYWCALWFWPIRQAGSLPSRDTWLLELSMILGDLEQGVTPEPGQGNLFAETQPKQLAVDFTDRHGFVDVQKLKAEFERLQQVELVAKRIRPLHWDLEFTDLLAHGGFDLFLGNPPWLRIDWSETGLLSEKDPLLSIRSLSAKQVKDARDSLLASRISLKASYLEEHEEASGAQTYLGSDQGYPLVAGSKNNLYKCFISLPWRLSRSGAIAGYVHPESIYDDPLSSKLRREMLARLRYHFQFQNQLILFPIAHRTKFSINIYRCRPGAIAIRSISNIISPKTIDASLEADASLVNPFGLKTDQGAWNVIGGSNRVLAIGSIELDLFNRIFGSSKDVAPPLPCIQNKETLSILSKFSNARDEHLAISDYTTSLMWHETNSQKDGSITRDVLFPTMPTEFVASGPNIGLCNPYQKTPRENCKKKGDYDVVDLTLIPLKYLPRTNYSVNVKPRSEWIAHPKVCTRAMLGVGGERTLRSALLPAEAMHISGCFSISSRDTKWLLSLCAALSSLPFDFLVRTLAKANMGKDVIEMFPRITPTKNILARSLGLNCISQWYSSIWEESWDEGYKESTWTRQVAGLDASFFAELKPDWNSSSFLKSDIARRQALLEIDVLVARQIGMSLDELIATLISDFPVFLSNEKDTWYDQNGRIVFTASKGLTGVGFPRKSSGRGPNKSTGWEEIADMRSGSVSRTIIDNTLPGGPVERTITYEAPFDRCNRVEDYRIAWEFFEKEGVA